MYQKIGAEVFHMISAEDPAYEVTINDSGGTLQSRVEKKVDDASAWCRASGGQYATKMAVLISTWTVMLTLFVNRGLRMLKAGASYVHCAAGVSRLPSMGAAGAAMLWNSRCVVRPYFDPSRGKPNRGFLPVSDTRKTKRKKAL